jgi:dihydroneopterin aldolase/2-amino-4-hydroxy-6-hydroxymethyldihydropteridine diphosphokinase
VSDRIVLRGLRGRGRHGVLAFERERSQDFLVDAILDVDVRAAAASDDLAATVDYGALAQRLVEIVEGEPVDLIETLAERLATVCTAQAGVRSAEVTVHKPHAPVGVPFADVAVTVVRAPVTVRRAVLALGTNLGDRAATLRGAVRALAAQPGLELVAVSPAYETVPVGGPDQGDYLNAVVVVDTDLPAVELLAAGHRVEAAYDRTRDIRWGPRTLDVDVVVVGDERRADGRLVLPHPRAHERAFVLAPWADIDPAAVLPGRGPVADLLAAVDTAGVRRLEDVTLR